jgi:hypothetical protein
MDDVEHRALIQVKLPGYAADMPLMPMGSFDWASNSRIAKHLSMAGTLLNAGDIMESKFVPYRKRMFFI